MENGMQNQVESLCAGVDDADKFMEFLCFAVDKLNKGYTVQAIWSDWQESAGQTEPEFESAGPR